MRKILKFPDDVGMHIRIASLIAMEASRYSSTISIYYRGGSYNVKSIIGLSSLLIEPGGKFELIAEGEDAEAAINGIEKLLTQHADNLL